MFTVKPARWRHLDVMVFVAAGASAALIVWQLVIR